MPSQCAAASADRFPVKRLTSARAARARKPAQLKLLGELSEWLGVVALLVEKLESRVAYCFDLGRCSKHKQKKKVNGLQAISSPKEPSQGSASGRLSNSGICVNINFVPAIKAFHKGRPIFG